MQIDHKIIAKKLKQIEILEKKGQIGRWIYNFLVERTQKVVVVKDKEKK